MGMSGIALSSLGVYGLRAVCALLLALLAPSAWSFSVLTPASRLGGPSTRGRVLTELAMGAFNPFTSRSKNTKVRWFDSELSKFYTFVESQPRLTHEQELQYGKALNMWMRVVSQRDQLQSRKLGAFHLAAHAVTQEANPDASLFGQVSLSHEILGASPEASADAAAGAESISGDSAPMGCDFDDECGAATSATAEIEFDAVPALGGVDDEVASSSGKAPEGVAVAVNSLDVPVDYLVTDDEVAAAVGCSVKTLEKIQRCAEISRTRLVNSNLKLVLAIVSRYRTSAIPNAELIAEGTRGLARAVERYDYSKGFRFATYATWYVHQAISDYVRWRKHPAKMPSRYLLLQRKVKEFTNAFKEQSNRSPVVKEIAEALHQSEFDVMKVMTMQTYPLLTNAPISLSRSQSKGADQSREKTLEDILASKHKTPATRSDSNDLRNDMEQMMRVNLNDVERDVLRLRLGLDDGRAKAVKEVGRRFKISWKQVRNVEKEALSKLLGSEEIHEFVQNYDSQPLSV